MPKPIETLAGADATAFRAAIRPYVVSILTELGYDTLAADIDAAVTAANEALALGDPAAPDTVAATAYALTAADHGRDKYFTAAGGCVITVPDTLLAGFACQCTQIGGVLTFVGSGALTVRSKSGSVATAGQYAQVLIKVRDNTLALLGGATG